MRLTPKQRRILEALAKPGGAFLGDEIYDTWTEAGMGAGRFERSLEALERRGLIVWRAADDVEITDEGRAAIAS